MGKILEFEEGYNPDFLTNYKNYGMYADMVRNRTGKVIYVPEEISASNIADHIDAVNAILKDGIDTDYVHNLKITVSWGGDLQCDLFIVDYWYNLFMWSMILHTGGEIRPKNIFWVPELKRKNIKKFVDDYVLTKENKIKYGNEFLNNTVCDGLWHYAAIEEFSYYLANTINNEDNIDLMNANPEFWQLMHTSLADVPFDQVKAQGMEITNRTIDIIKDSAKYIGYEHGLANSFRASEAINPRQFKEAELNIGTKPNGSGGIYPVVIDTSFMRGGVNNPLYYFIESSTARAAQIMSKTNVGESGDFARLLGLNNTDTILNPHQDYECMSEHFIRFYVRTEKHLSMIKNRYYRFNPRGLEYLVDDKDTSLVGKTIYMRSPMTCASLSSGHGICKRCYGDLYYTNIDINAGKIAAEILSAQLTQTLLSAKHLLESKIVKIEWNNAFYEFFNVEINTIQLNPELSKDINALKRYTLIIDPDEVNLVNEEEDAVTFEDDEGNTVVSDDAGVYNEYINKFQIRMPDGDVIDFGSTTEDNLYISNELNAIIRKKAYASEGKVNIPLNTLIEIPLFYIEINNNEISKTMNDIINVINKSSVTEHLSKSECINRLVDLVVEGNLDIDSVHLEVILANQIVDPSNIMKKPNWNDPAAKYKMFTLNQALTNNPSVIISLLYKDLHRVLYNPLTFKKNSPSFFDLFFAEQPQVYMSDNLIEESPIELPNKKIEIVKIVGEDKG